MPESSLLKGKKILAVDDEPDILQVLEELLWMCEVVKATTFEEAKILLENDNFDLAILDIMGVNGYALLEIANSRNITAVMLTAHAFTPEHLAKSIKKGAASYIPKEEISNVILLLDDILNAKKNGISTWNPWGKRLPSSYFEERWGVAWKDKDKGFWDKFLTGIRDKGKKPDKYN
jgi:DNA-binding NtrC family response regulator